MIKNYVFISGKIPYICAYGTQKWSCLATNVCGCVYLFVWALHHKTPIVFITAKF